MGIGLLFGALAGAGGAVADIGKRDQDVANDEKRVRMLADLEEQKVLRIEEARAQRQRQAGIAQGSQIASEASRLLGQSDAAAINAKFGSNATAEDVAALAANPEARKAYGLPEVSRLSSLETKAAAAENLGYMEASRDARGLIQAEITNLRNEASDKATIKRLDEMERHNRSIEARNASVAAADLAFRREALKNSTDAELRRADSEKRQATNAAMKNAQTELDKMRVEFANPMLDDKLKPVMQAQINELQKQTSRFRDALAAAGLDGSEKPESKTGFDPSKYPIGGKPSTSASTGASEPIASRSQPSMQGAPDSRISGQVVMPSIGAKFPIIKDESGERKLDISSDVILQNLRKALSSVPSAEGKMKIGTAINNRIDQLQQLENEIATSQFRNPLKLTGL